jgi:hypothetical protein
LKENEIDFGEIDNIYESNILVANKIYNIQIVCHLNKFDLNKVEKKIENSNLKLPTCTLIFSSS